MHSVYRDPSARPFHSLIGLAGAAAVLGLAAPAQALTIVPVFTSSVTSQSNAKLIEADVDAAAKVLDADLKAPVTVTIDIDWGNLNGSAIPSYDISQNLASIDNGFTYSEVSSYLKAAAATNPTDTNLVTAAASLAAKDPLPVNNFEITTADAKALGLLPPTMTNVDGYLGFNSSTKFNFGTTAVTGEYDFEAFALHEMSEILGRQSALNVSSPSDAMLFDLYRYSSSGVHSFSHTAAAYFSINGGKTNLGAFYDNGAYDRGDWLSTTTLDAQNAALPSGKMLSLSTADLTALDALGWDTRVNPGGWAISASPVSGVAGAAGGVPEPATWTLALIGLGLMGAALRRHPAAISAA
jgi:PEP-CTERM motif